MQLPFNICITSFTSTILKRTTALMQSIEVMASGYMNRHSFKKKDDEKEQKGNWHLSNEMAGMSLYVDRFCGTLVTCRAKIPYLKNWCKFFHLMPNGKPGASESDGGMQYQTFRKVDKRFGTIEELKAVQEK